MKISDAIAIRLKNILKEREMSVYSLIKNGGLSKTTVFSILKSRNKCTTLKSVLEVTDTLDITITEFFNDPIFDNLDLTIE